MTEGTYPVPIRRRSRIKRAMRWPLLVWQYRRAGGSWAMAFKLTHWIIWYPNNPVGRPKDATE